MPKWCVIFFSFHFLRGPPPSSHINHTHGWLWLLWMPILSFACFLTAFLNLHYSNYILPLEFHFPLFLYTFIYFFLHCLLCSREADPDVALHFLVLLLQLSSLFLLWYSLPASPPIPASASLLTVHFFIITIKCFRQVKNHSFTVNKMQHKQK